ncbi:hypothetical protein KY334_03780 [Candidatus Woesearchaeota archaeon]|nr:hypothetical protein [Candidatus Woesearchaeota archaeon]
MNKKGISDGFMLIIQLIAIGLIFTLLIYKVNDLDIEAIHRLVASKNLALSFSTITFLPGSFTFGAFNPEFDNKLTSTEFYVKLSIDKIAYFEEIPSEMELRLSPNSYYFFSNKKAIYSDYIKDYQEEVEVYQEVRIEKSDDIDLSNHYTLTELECKNTSRKYTMRTLNICDKDLTITKYCDDDGTEVCKSNDDYEQKENINCDGQTYNLKVTYDGFEPKFSLGNSKAYLAKGKTTQNYQEVKILKDYLLKANNNYQNKQSILDNLSKKKNFTETVLITFNNEDLDEINIKIPYDYFEDNYAFGCEFHNDVVILLFNKKSDLIKAVNVIPTNSNSIIVELGNMKNDDYMKELFPEIMTKLMGYYR